jgi:octaprenyl-diphosphate synthase
MKSSSTIISQEIKEFERLFKEAVKSDVPLLDRITKYIVKTKGKQLRPMFVLLSAKLCGTINDSTYRAASLVELLHTATLVHDDVVDEAAERRGFFSTYALWKNKASVLVGDYLLAKGLLLSLEHDDFKILQILADAVKKMSEGELLQLEKSRLLNIKEEDYFTIIRNKTASLLASACSAGAYSSTNDLAVAEKMRKFGEYTGIAFQIKDDLFDYGTQDVGKPTGNDIKERKMTLPLIYTLEKSSSTTKREIISIIKNKNKSRKDIETIIHKVKDAGGIEYANQKMIDYKNEAEKILLEFPDIEARSALMEMLHFTTERKN